MTKPLSRAAAIREARRLITIGAHGSQYVVYMPHLFSNPTGPGTTSLPRDWWQTRAGCTHARAELALTLMGLHSGAGSDLYWEVQRAREDGITGVEQLVAHVARRLAA